MSLPEPNKNWVTPSICNPCISSPEFADHTRPDCVSPDMTYWHDLQLMVLKFLFLAEKGQNQTNIHQV